MILNYAKGPFIKNVPTIPSMMRDVIFTLSVLLIIPIVQYGVRPLVMAVCTMFVSVICEIIFNLIQGNKIGAGDGSSLVTGLMIVMLMPVNAPIWLPCMAAVFAVIVAKMPFGAFGHTPFNPAAAGVAFAALCYPHLVFRYIDSSAKNLPAFGDCTGDIVSSTAAVLKNGLKPSILPLDMLWGAFEGPLGTTGILIICAGGLYLFIKRTANWEITAAFLAAALIIAAFWPRIECSMITSVKYELLSGSLLFCSVFMVTDPVTSPRTKPAKIAYGFICGVLVMVFRRFGAFEQGACFALLIANALAPQIDVIFSGSFETGDVLYEK